MEQISLKGAPESNEAGFDLGLAQYNQIVQAGNHLPVRGLYDREADTLALIFIEHRPVITYFAPQDEDFLFNLDSATGELVSLEITHFKRVLDRLPELKANLPFLTGWRWRWRNPFGGPKIVRVRPDQIEHLMPCLG